MTAKKIRCLIPNLTGELEIGPKERTGSLNQILYEVDLNHKLAVRLSERSLGVPLDD